ncbi:MAG: MerR family DNA-binding protein [Burkholderiaceae bacterium]
MTPNPSTSLTIGRLARAADVGVETIRYYQQRGLLPVPAASGAFRHYPVELAARIRFVKRAQELGFSLDEITELLRLEDGAHRGAIRQIASARLDQVEQKLLDLKRMQRVLKHLVAECEHTHSSLPCPIIAALEGPSGTNPTRRAIPAPHVVRNSSLRL